MTKAPATARADVDAEVLACDTLCHAHVLVEIGLRHFPDSEPGQFLQLQCRPGTAEAAVEAAEWPRDGFPSLTDPDSQTPHAYLRRPFSIADQWRDDHGITHLQVISHAVGLGTRWLAQLNPGDTLNVTGPLGRGFRLPAPATPLVLVGGGVGIPPLLYLTRRLHERGYRDVLLIFGARSGELLPLHLHESPATDAKPVSCVTLPGSAPYPALITSDDGSIGLAGRVTDALSAWYAQRSPVAPPPLVCACGPEPMLKAVAHATRRLGLACQLCIERHMGCGLGTCLSCVVRAHDAARPVGWRWALACTDGPVFDRDELLDYAE